MDVQTPLICAGVVAVSAAVVYLTSILGIRERTYEEAIEEQRRRSSLETNVKTSKTDKPKKDKKDKLKKINKKSKDKNNDGVQQNSEPKIQIKESDSHEQNLNRKTEHVGFKPEPEIVLLNTDEQNIDIGRQRRASYDKPIKPILTNKNDQYIDQNQYIAVQGQRSNSFDLILPKDEFELLKDSKKILDKEIIEEVIETVVNSNYQEVMSSISSNSVESDSIQVLELEVKHEVVKSENHENSSPARKTKRAKQSQAEGNTKEVSAKVIIDLVKSATLTNEEIQLLTDVLLNKQSDGSTEWRKKNDPLSMIKKQLQEKEAALEAETKNLQAAVQKTRELRLELDTEKSKQLNSREKAQQMQQEVQTLHRNLQENYEKHRNEMKAMQTQMQQIQAKMTEERSLALRLQEENSRLHQLIKNDSHLKQEIEQLRNERQQYEMRIASIQKSNDELVRKTQQYDNHIKSLADSRQKDEISYQKHVNDVKQELQKSEAQKLALVEELNHTSSKCNTLETESIQLRKRYDEFEGSKNDEIKRLIEQLTEVNKEKSILENALTEAKHQHQNGDMNEAKDEKLNKLNEELNATKEELNNLKNALENQLRNNEELKEKNRLSLESLENMEKSKNECVQNALKGSEEAYNKLINEKEKIQKENDALNHKLAEAVDVKNLHVQEIELLKEVLQEIFPSLDTTSHNWVSSIETTFNELISQRPLQSSTDEQTLHKADQRIQELESLLETEKQKTSELEVKVSQFATTLSETESILSNLQNKIESEEMNRQLRQKEYENELNNRLTENNKLIEQNRNLETSLSQLQGLRESIAEMEHNLKELQSKLQGKENETKLWEAKYDEVSKRQQANKEVLGLKEELNERTKEMESFQSDKTEIDRIKAECEELRISLEKEKKLSKDLNLQNVRLNSLVKIGHESLKLEEDKVKQLEAQLNLNNGGLSSPNNCSAANGSPESVPLNTSNLISDSTEEAASVKK